MKSQCTESPVDQVLRFVVTKTPKMFRLKTCYVVCCKYLSLVCIFSYYTPWMYMLICRHLPAIGESLATLVAAMPVAFLEPHLNAHNPLSVFNTKTPRERASECPPDPPFHFDHHHIYLQCSDIPVLRFLKYFASSKNFKNFFLLFFHSSPEYAGHSGGDVSGVAAPWQTAERCQRCVRVWCSLQWNATGLRGWWEI